MFGRKEKSPLITSLIVKEEVITDDIKIANGLNEHFATGGEQLQWIPDIINVRGASIGVSYNRTFFYPDFF